MSATRLNGWNSRISQEQYCPCVQKNLEQQMCPQCGIYHPSIAAFKQHDRGTACAYNSIDDKGDSGTV